MQMKCTVSIKLLAASLFLYISLSPGIKLICLCSWSCIALSPFHRDVHGPLSPACSPPPALLGWWPTAPKGSPISVLKSRFSYSIFQLDICTYMLIRHLRTNTSKIELLNFLTKSAPPAVFLFSVNAVHAANCSFQTSQSLSLFLPCFCILLGFDSSSKHCACEARLELRKALLLEPWSPSFHDPGVATYQHM